MLLESVKGPDGWHKISSSHITINQKKFDTIKFRESMGLSIRIIKFVVWLICSILTAFLLNICDNPIRRFFWESISARKIKEVEAPGADSERKVVAAQKARDQINKLLHSNDRPAIIEYFVTHFEDVKTSDDGLLLKIDGQENKITIKNGQISLHGEAITSKAFSKLFSLLSEKDDEMSDRMKESIALHAMDMMTFQSAGNGTFSLKGAESDLKYEIKELEDDQIALVSGGRSILFTPSSRGEFSARFAVKLAAGGKPLYERIGSCLQLTGPGGAEWVVAKLDINNGHWTVQNGNKSFTVKAEVSILSPFLPAKIMSGEV